MTTTYECDSCGALVSDGTNHTCASGRITVLSNQLTNPVTNVHIVSIDESIRRALLKRTVLAIIHTDRAAERGDRDAIQHHRGYRKGVADTMALLVGEDWAHSLKTEAYTESRKSDAELPPLQQTVSDAEG